MSGAKEVATPMSNNTPLSLSDKSPSVDPTPFRKLFGSLQYLAFTRPDVSFVVNKLSQYMHAPTEFHWQALKRVLCFLKGTLHHGLFLRRGSPLTLQVFSDSDWGSTMDNEVKYKAAVYVVAETIWDRQLLQELGVNLRGPPILHCDNVTNGSLKVCHIISHDQLADMLTKPLGKAQFLLQSKIGVSNGASILRGRIRERSSKNTSHHINCN